jgi:hypothetical protein
MKRIRFKVVCGLFLMAISSFGLVEYFQIIGLNPDLMSISLMEGRGYLLESADMLFNPFPFFANRGPRFDLGLASRILFGYSLTFVVGAVLVARGNSRKGVRRNS